MHELSVAQSLIEIVGEHVAEDRRATVRVVRVRVGSLSGVVPAALEFCFGALVTGTPLAAARLEIERVPLRLSCRSCRGRFENVDPRFTCPGCGGTSVELENGSELDVSEVELEERPAEAP